MIGCFKICLNLMSIRRRHSMGFWNFWAATCGPLVHTAWAFCLIAFYRTDILRFWEVWNLVVSRFETVCSFSLFPGVSALVLLREQYSQLVYYNILFMEMWIVDIWFAYERHWHVSWNYAPVYLWPYKLIVCGPTTGDRTRPWCCIILCLNILIMSARMIL